MMNPLFTVSFAYVSLKSVTITNEVLDAEQMKRLIWGHYKNEVSSY